MKTSGAFLGVTGSVVVLIFGVTLVFFQKQILPASGAATKFDPDSFIMLVAGLLGLFGGLTGAAGSALSFWDAELSGIMLLGAAVSGAAMFAGFFALYPQTHVAIPNKIAVLVTGIMSFLLLTVSGVISLVRREPAEELR